MLKLLRHKDTQKKIYIFLAVAVVVTFVVSGVIIGETGNESRSPLGTIDGRKISLQDYLASYKASQHQAAWAYGERYHQVRRLINFRSEAWDRLLLLHHARKENIRVSDREVVDWLASQSGFSNKGVFDTGFYRRYVKDYLRMDPRQFEEEVRQMLQIRKISEKLRSDVTCTDEALKALYAEENAERDISYGILPWETEKPGVPAPDDKTLEDFYPAVQDELTDPERVKIKYLEVPKERAEAFQELLSAKTEDTLEALSTKYGLPVQATGLFSKDDPEIAKRLPVEIVGFCFMIPEQKETGWITIDQGSFKIFVEAKEPARPIAFAQAGARLKDLWVKRKASETAVKKLDEARQKSGADFGALLKNAGIAETRRLEQFGKGRSLPTPAASDAFEQAVAPLKPGEISAAFAVPEGAAILTLEKISSPDDKKFSEEKEAFKKRLVDQKTQEAFNALLETLRAKLTVDLETMKKIFNEEP
ncbi:MAG: SurA N-terminal domain-containing protein [Candidatus Omnitrophica bacterium]|nr:SurA N-terminal domain-containing protein [Candidatus Omnitrophota bacterium]